MRRPEFLSPSSLKTFEANKDEFYLKYLADKKPPRLGQINYMAVGSSFDAHTKAYLYEKLYGNFGPSDAYKFENIFEKQVEPHCRDEALRAGKDVFDRYKKSGALADLMLELSTAINTPRFEFDIKGTVRTKIGEVPLLGKPDIFFINGEGARVVPDWKVNGYYGKNPTSPKKGYIKIRDGWHANEGPPSKGNHQPHKDCWPTVKLGIKMNPTLTLAEVDTEWADQITIYGWLLGEEVGSTTLVGGIEQVVGPPPFLRFASHRCLASTPAYQYNLLERIEKAWAAIVNGKEKYFPELTEDESTARCDHLEEQAEGLAGADEFSQFVNEVSRKR